MTYTKLFHNKKLSKVLTMCRNLKVSKFRSTTSTSERRNLTNEIDGCTGDHGSEDATWENLLHFGPNLELQDIHFYRPAFEYLKILRETFVEDGSQGSDTNSADKQLTSIALHRCSFASIYSTKAFIRFMSSISGLRVLHIDDASTFNLDELYWEILLHGLVQVPQLRCLQLCNSDLRGPNIGQSLSELLRAQDGKLQILDLSCCLIDHDFIAGLARGLRGHGGLRQLKITWMDNLRDVDFEILVDALVDSPSKHTLQLFSLEWLVGLTSQSFVGLTRILDACNNLEELDMSHCITLFKGANQTLYLQFIDALRRNRSLKVLDFGFCGVTSQLAGPLLRAMEVNSTLEELNVRHEKLTESLAKSLPCWKGLRILHANVDFECDGLRKALLRNTSLIIIHGAYARSKILHRNKLLTQTIPRILRRRDELNAANWPLCVESLMRDCDDMSPVFSFVGNTLLQVLT